MSSNPKKKLRKRRRTGRTVKVIAVILVLFVAVISIFWAFAPPGLYPKKNRIAIIELSGEIVSGEESEFYTTTGEIQRSLEKAKRDDSIKAVVLAVDSPGGYATSSYEMYSMVKRFEKPVVAFARGTVASGSYLVSLGADKRVAHPFSKIGSVGVYIDLGKPVPIEPENATEITSITSGKLKDLWADGVLDENERAYLKLRVDEAKDIFLNLVLKETEIAREKVERVEENLRNPWYVLIEGGWFYGNEAFELGLVDSIGDLEDSLKLASELAGIKYEEAEVVKIEPPAPGTYDNMLYETPLYQQEDNESLPIHLK